MTTTLFIVESPNKAKTINSMFPGRFEAISTGGHICDLPQNPEEGSIGIDRVAMKGQYQLTEDKTRFTDGKRTVAKLKKYIADHPGLDLYIATDEDREGESIAAFVAHYLGLKNPKRMRLRAINKEAIEHAYNNTNFIDYNAVSSREARRLIDRIIGYVGSPILRSRVKGKGVAAGRVQTAVEALVVERERKLRNHKSQPYYTVGMELGGWTAEWQVPSTAPARTGPKPNSEYDIDEADPKCFDQALAQQIATIRALTIESSVDRIETKLPPSPLYTFSMIQTANRVLGWDAEKTMQIAQKLFEGDGAGHGHITYHRTDSPNMDEGAANEIRAWLKNQGLPIPVERNKWDNKNKQAQEGHEAIRPYHFEVEEAGTNDEQRALYKLIRERAIYSQLAPAKYAAKRIVLTDATHTHKFTANARALIDPGWLKTPSAQSPTMQEDEDQTITPPATLPNLQKDNIINVKKADVTAHTTKAPPRYTMNTLTSKLEKLSIGRPATIAPLLKNVQAKGTIVVRKDKKLEATPLAETCYDVLYPKFAFAHIGYTAELELALDQIASGQLDGPSLVRNVWDRLDADGISTTIAV